MDKEVLRKQVIAELLAKSFALPPTGVFSPGDYWECLPQAYINAFDGKREMLVSCFDQYKHSPEKIEGFAVFLEDRLYPDLPDYLRVTHR